MGRVRARCLGETQWRESTFWMDFTIIKPICKNVTLEKTPLYFNLTPALIHFCICRVFAGQRVLSPVPEHWPGRCEAQPLHQCQLRPRLQCLPELLCCDRYNTTRTRSSAKRVNTAAAGQRQRHRDCQANRVLLDFFVILSQPHITDSSR